MHRLLAVANRVAMERVAEEGEEQDQEDVVRLDVSDELLADPQDNPVPGLEGAVGGEDPHAIPGRAVGGGLGVEPMNLQEEEPGMEQGIPGAGGLVRAEGPVRGSINVDRWIGPPVPYRRRPCIIPDCPGDSYPKVHAWDSHLPGVFSRRESEMEDNPVRLRFCLEALLEIASLLVPQDASLQGLVGYINGKQPSYLQYGQPTGIAELPLREWMTFLGLERPVGGFRVYPITSVGGLVHWRVLMWLLSELGPEDRVRLRREHSVGKVSAAVMNGWVYDAHCHLDRLWERHGVRIWGPRGREVRDPIMGACTTFCDPESWPSGEQISALHPDIDVAVGWHPKKTTQGRKRERLAQLERILDHPRVVALGEIGLDHTVGFQDWARQNEVLLDILRLARGHQVIMFHARGMPEDIDSEAVLTLLRCLAIKGLSRGRLIYLHCFTGGPNMVERWLEAFPNTYFGFTKLVGEFNSHQREGLARVPGDRILLETDAPHFAWPGEAYSTPGRVSRVAELVAEVRGWQPGECIALARVNAVELFRGRRE